MLSEVLNQSLNKGVIYASVKHLQQKLDVKSLPKGTYSKAYAAPKVELPSTNQFLRNQRNESLLGGFNPSEKYARQIGSFPQTGVKIKNV